MAKRNLDRERAEAAVKRVNEMQAARDYLSDYVCAIMARHAPRLAGRVDLSLRGLDNAHEEIGKEVAKNIWCSYCNHRWPCPPISDLRPLKSVLSYSHDIEHDSKDLAESVEGEPRRPKLSGLEFCL